MKVRTLILFNDLQSKKLRKVGECFDATPKRVEELNSTRYGALVEVIEKEVEVGEKRSVKKSR